MRKLITTLILATLTISAGAQRIDVNEVLKACPQKAYGNDCPYQFEDVTLTKAPDGYKPFYISHYARHGSRYYWNSQLYQDLDTLLTKAHDRQQLTAEGEAFYQRFSAVKDELMTGWSELTQLGWEQHQGIARRMYEQFPEVFEKGGNVLAISSLSGRCMLSMSAFCQELTQCNPKIEIREQSSRFTLDGVVPIDERNPVKHNFPKAHPRYELNRDQYKGVDTLGQQVVKRVFTSTEGLGQMWRTGEDLINLYTSLPSIGYVGMMGNLVNDEELIARWETSNLFSYSWVFDNKYYMIPILQDIFKKANAVIDGSCDRVADLRFGHDTCIGPLTVLLGLNGADLDPVDPYEVKYCYQNWETCMASNIQLIFYRGNGGKDDVIVKCLLDGKEASLPVPTDNAPYYRWADFCSYYNTIIASADKQ